MGCARGFLVVVIPNEKDRAVVEAALPSAKIVKITTPGQVTPCPFPVPTELLLVFAFLDKSSAQLSSSSSPLGRGEWWRNSMP